MDRGAWGGYSPWHCKELDMTERLTHTIMTCAEHLFMCWPYVCLSWRNVFLGLLILKLGCFFFLVLSCMSCLYILEINPFSVVSFSIIFFHSEVCLFISFRVPFAVQNLLSLIRHHLLIFVFISITLWGGSKRILQQILLSTQRSLLKVRKQ